MSDIISGVLACFGLKSNRTTREKGYYICQTDRGTVKLSKTNETMETLLFTHGVKEHAAKNGFTYTDRYITGTGGTPLVQMGVDGYTLTRAVIGRELDYNCPEDVSAGMAQLARFHAAAQNFPEKGTITPPQYEVIKRGIENLSTAVKQIRKQKQRSDMDFTLLKHAPYYTEQAEQALEKLAASNYIHLYNQALSKNHITHNNIKEEHFIFTDTGLFITAFNKATCDIQLADIAAYLRRYALRGDASLSIAQLLAAYHQNNPLPEGAEAVVRGFLLYPAPFIKLVEQCYSKKRSWIPAGLSDRMAAVLAAEVGYRGYLGK